MRNDIEHALHMVQIEQMERDFRIFLESARKAMRAAKIAIQEGDEEEAIRLIDEALGDEPETT